MRRGVVARRIAVLGAVLGTVVLAFAAGFVLFARAVAQYSSSPSNRAEAIVVLTGGELRLVAAAKLLAEGRGTRLLISGVNPQTTLESLQRISELSERLFACCVDIDYASSTTRNADETKAWAKARGFKRLILVTSSYHMPRSLVELARAMPGVTLAPPSRGPTQTSCAAMVGGCLYGACAPVGVSQIPAVGRPLLHRARHAVGERGGVDQRPFACGRQGDRNLLLARSLAFLIVFYVNTALFLVLGSWLLLGPRRWAMEGLRLHGLTSLWWLKMICGTRVEVRGREKIPDGACLVASKHQSAWDTFGLIPVFRDPAMVMKAELGWIPFYGWFSHKFEHIFVKRDRGPSALKAMIRDGRATEELRDARS